MIQGKLKKIFFLTSRLLWLGFPFFQKFCKKEKQLGRWWLLLQQLVVRLNYILQYNIQHYNHQLLNGSSSTKSFISWFLQNIGKEYCTKKINNKKYIPERLHKT